jgi:hypothetical protein
MQKAKKEAQTEIQRVAQEQKKPRELQQIRIDRVGNGTSKLNRNRVPRHRTGQAQAMAFHA